MNVVVFTAIFYFNSYHPSSLQWISNSQKFTNIDYIYVLKQLNLDNNQNIAISLINITKKYAETIALNDVSVSFTKGKITSIYGPNGAGKSTLVKIICGEETPNNGYVELNGKKISFAHYKEAVEQGISYVPQDFGLINNLTVWENIAIVLNQIDHRFLFNNKRKNDLPLFIKNVNLPLPDLDTIVEDLTSYEKQILSIYKALLLKSDIIIFDESTTNIGREDFQKFKQIITQLIERRKTIIIISHKLDEVFDISDEMVILKEGRILKKCVIKETSKEEIIELFITAPQLIKINEKSFKEETTLAKISLETGNKDKFQLNILKGEVITIDSRDTSFNQELGYTIFEKLSSIKSLKTGIIPALRDEQAVFGNLSVKDNLLMNILDASLFLDKKKNNERLENIANELNIDYSSWDQNISELSGGNKQKVILGRWILSEFDILVLIEPTSGIDIETKEVIYRKIKELTSIGKSFILISSDKGEQEMLQTRKITITKKYEAVC